ncbi:MAG: copper amine oxidase N-terminal domain-containing protein [Candidatus Eremiobacteraeota bacterium]|nr:copper amine oxidase N-terminal domain-containing protein [Candidatus Eremiobacteraeota bacterium]
MEKRSRSPLRRVRPPRGRSISLTTFAAIVAAALLSLSKPVALHVDGRRMLSDVPPVTTPKGAYVPLRLVAESLGAETSYDLRTGVIVLVRAHDTMRLRNGDRVATFDGKKVLLPTAPFSVRGRTMVALTTIARAFGTKVSYDRARANIDVMEPGIDIPPDTDENQ